MTTFEQIESLLDEAHSKLEEANTLIMAEELDDCSKQGIAILWARNETRHIALSLSALHGWARRWAARSREDEPV